MLETVTLTDDLNMCTDTEGHTLISKSINETTYTEVEAAWPNDVMAREHMDDVLLPNEVLRYLQ